MSCQLVDTATLERDLQFASTLEVYAADDTASASTVLRFQWPQPPDAGAVFLVRALNSGAWVYRGPAVPSLRLRFDARLSGQHGDDNLHFFLINPVSRQTCAWLNERSERYWVDGQTADIAWLPQGEFDAQGLFRQHGVQFQR